MLGGAECTGGVAVGWWSAAVVLEGRKLLHPQNY